MGITEERIKRITEQAAAMKKIGKMAVDVSGELDALVSDNAAMEAEIQGLNEANDRLRERLNRGESHDAYMELPLDADGVPIRIGDVLYSSGNECRVVSITVKADEACVGVHTDEGVFLPSVNPKYLSRKKPEPTDSWEKLEEDIKKRPCSYFDIDQDTASCDDCPHGSSRTGTVCWLNALDDMIARAKKLAGIEELEGGEQ